MDTVTLKNIFETNKYVLSEKLNNLSLPRDAQKVQEIVANFLSSLFEKDGLYRQKLTESEDYILQAALQLLQTQQKITEEVATSIKDIKISQQIPNRQTPNKGMDYTAVLGAGIGAAVCGLFGTWWSVCGAIAGTAIAIYCSSNTNKTKVNKECNNEPTAASIDITVFSSIVEKVCESIDNLMQTFRIQIKRIENNYAQIDKPSLLTECSTLFEQISNVHKALENNRDQTPVKVVSAIEMLEESLENYGLKIKDGKVTNE